MKKQSEYDIRYLEIKEKCENKLKERYYEYLESPNEYETPINTLRYDFKAIIYGEKNELKHYIDNDNCYEIKIKRLALSRFQSGKLGRYPSNPVKAFIEIIWKELKTSILIGYNENPTQLKIWQKIEVEFANADIDEVIQLLAVSEAHENVQKLIESDINNKNEVQQLGEISEYSGFKSYFKAFEKLDDFLQESKDTFRKEFDTDGVKAFYFCYLLYKGGLLKIHFVRSENGNFLYNKSQFTRDFNYYFFDNTNRYTASSLLHHSKFSSVDTYNSRIDLEELRKSIRKLIKKYQG